MTALPSQPGPRLLAAWQSLTEERQAALLPHLLGDTSAEYLAGWFNRAGQRVSATTIRTYRRSLRQKGGEP